MTCSEIQLLRYIFKSINILELYRHPFRFRNYRHNYKFSVNNRYPLVSLSDNDETEADSFCLHVMGLHQVCVH
jgi:hypothetical protein